MSDEPPKENPQPQQPDFSKPAPSIWETFAKNRIEIPRDIAEEVRNEFGGIDRPEKSLDQKEIVIRLANGFREYLKKLAEESDQRLRRAGYPEEIINERFKSHNNGVNEMVFGEDYMYLVSFITHQENWQRSGDPIRYETLPKSEQFVELQLVPTNRSANEEGKLLSTSQLGEVPIFFKGSDGKRYQAKNCYRLNPFTGEGKKIEEIWPYGDDTWGYLGNLNALKFVDFETNSVEERVVDLTPGDFEQLNSILYRMQTGDIKPRYQPIQPYKG